MNIKHHRSGRICVISYMNSTLRQIPNQPGIHRPKKQITCFCLLPRSCNMIQYPRNFRCRKISIRNQSRRLSYIIGQTIFHQFFNVICCSSALPHNRIVNRLSCMPVPDNRRFSLIRDTNPRYIFAGHTNFTHRLCRNR